MEIEKLMKNLDLTREEAQALLEEDKKIDRMTSMKKINNDLTDEQKKASKKARSVDRKPKAQTKREKKVNNEKIEIINALVSSLGEIATEINIINNEREIEFFSNEKKYKIVLSCPRK